MKYKESVMNYFDLGLSSVSQRIRTSFFMKDEPLLAYENPSLKLDRTRWSILGRRKSGKYYLWLW